MAGIFQRLGFYVIGFASLFLFWHAASAWWLNSVLFPTPWKVVLKAVELAEAVVSLGDRNRLVETVERKLRGALEGMEGEREKSVINVVRETLKELRPSSDIHESARHYLAGIDAEFYQRLRASYPDLTPKQERLCGLIRAGLSSREISTLMDLEAEGLKAQRKRLRKRLNLQPDERLEMVLAGV